MKCNLTAAGLVLLVLITMGQTMPNTPGATPEGLLYPDSTITYFRQIIDSINQQFKVRPVSKAYHSMPQATAFFVELSGTNLSQAKQELDDKMSFDEFMKRHPDAQVSSKGLLTLSWMRRGKDSISLLDLQQPSLDAPKGIWLPENPHTLRKRAAGSWLVFYHPGSANSMASIKAFYLTSSFSTQPLAAQYAAYIQYVDCLIDTTQRIYTENAAENEYRQLQLRNNDSSLSKVYAFQQLLYSDSYGPKSPPMSANGKDVLAYAKASNIYRKLRKKYITDSVIASPGFAPLFRQAYAEAVITGKSTDDIEYFAERLISPYASLQLKRNREIRTKCGLDVRPDIHNQHIARLSAASRHWPIFLRAHLATLYDEWLEGYGEDLVWEKRTHHLAELETMQVDVTTLLVGMYIQTGNPAPNHYTNASAWQIAKLIRELKCSECMEKKLLSMLSDVEIDNYNRVHIYRLLLAYAQQHPAGQQEALMNRLQDAAKTLPDYLAGK